MAEIHVQAKKQRSSPAWIWILIVLLIAAVVIYFVAIRNKTATNNPQNTNNTTSGLELPQRMATAETYVLGACV